MNQDVRTPLIIACALFMENLDGTIIATSLPAIAADLHENPLALKLALTSYLLSLAVFIPASGWAADRFGARRVFRAAILVFTLGSILCGLSDGLGGFIAARIVQGFGGAMMTPVGRLVLLRTVERAKMIGALAYLTAPALVGPVIGPPLGGFITTYFHWRWIFWINAPIGVLGFVLATLYIADVREEKPRPLDVTGFFLSGLGLSGLVFGLTALGRDLIAPALDWALIGGGAGALGLYVVHARRTPYPILDLGLLAIPTFRASLVGGFLFRIGVGAIPFLLPLMLQVGFGLNPFQSGSLTFAAAAGALLMKTTAAPILRRVGFRTVLLVDTLISAGFLASYGLFTAATPTTVIVGLLLVGGFFRSLQFTALNALGYAEITSEAMSRATSFASVGQQLSLSVGVALGAAALEGSRAARGGVELAAVDFAPAFAIAAFVSASALFAFLPLGRDAGSEVSGRVSARQAPGA